MRKWDSNRFSQPEKCDHLGMEHFLLGLGRIGERIGRKSFVFRLPHLEGKCTAKIWFFRKPDDARKK